MTEGDETLYPSLSRPLTTFDPPLDKGIKRYVELLWSAGIETFESCEGGEGHAFPEPTVKFHGVLEAGWRALAACLAYGFPVKDLRRTWDIIEREVRGPCWELVFWPRNEHD